MEKSFSPLIKNYLVAVFSLNIPNPPPSLSPSFLNLIPTINLHKLNLSKLLDSKDISNPIKKLHLTFEDRFPALSVIFDNDYSILASEDGKTFTTIYILQSITPIFLKDGEYFDDEIIKLLINLLIFAQKISSNFAKLIDQTFSFLFDKIIRHANYFSFIPDIVEYLKYVTKFPSSWFQTHLAFLHNILLAVIQKPNPASFAITFSYLSILFSHFSKINLKNMDDNNVESIYKIIDIIYNEFPVKNENISKTDQYIQLRNESIKLGIELNRLTKFPFIQYIPIIIKSVSKPFIPKEDLEATTDKLTYKTDEISEERILKIIETQTTPLDFDSYQPPTIQPIEDYLVQINHPILQYHKYLTSTFTNESISSIIQLMITDGSNEIIDGDSSIRIFLFFEIDQLENLSDISSKIIQRNKKQLFFTKTLFKPAITIFNNPNSVLLSVRQLMSKVFVKLVNNKTSSFFMPILADNLNKFVPYPQMFAEFFYFFGRCFSQSNFSIGPDLILNCVSHALQIQQEMTMNNLPYHNEVKILTLKSLDQFVDAIKDKKLTTFKTSTFFIEFLYLIFDNSISSHVLSILQKYCTICSICDKSSIADLFRSVIPVLDFCYNHISICLPQCTRLLYTFFELLCGLNNDKFDVDENSLFFEKCRQFIYLDGSNIDSIAYALMIDHVTNQMQDENEWKKIAAIVEKHEMSEAMYESVSILLSHNNEPFTAIGNKYATCLIPIVLKSPFCIDFLKKLHCILDNSIPDQVVFAQLGLSQELIKILTEDADDQIWRLVLQMIQMIFVNTTKRNDLFAFFRLFSPISKNKQTKHMQELLNVITNIVTYQPISYRSAIRFTSKRGYIELPNFDFRKLPSGFTLSMNILISNFRKSSDYITIFTLCNNKSILKGELYSSGLKIVSNLYNETLSIDFDCKINKWFVFSVTFITPCKVIVHCDHEQVGCGSLDHQVYWPASFDNNTLFGEEGSGFVELLFTKAAIFANTNEYEFPDLMKDRNEQLNTLLLLDTRMYVEGKIRDFITKRKLYTIVKGEQFSDINPFSITFDYTNGIPFLISLFSQIDYEIESTESNYNNTLYLNLLLNIICGMIQLLDYEDKLLDIHLFEITAYFLYNSKKISMNQDLYAAFDNLRQSIGKKSKELEFVFIRSIFLNYQLWRSADSQTLQCLFNVWNSSISAIPDVLSKELRPPLILNVLISLYETNLMNDDLRNILFKILSRSLSVKCTQLDISMIFSVMHISKDNINEIDQYLNMLKQFISDHPEHLQIVSKTIVRTEWITLYDNPNIKFKLMDTFLNSDRELYIHFILKNIEYISKQNEDYINSSFSNNSAFYFKNPSDNSLFLPLLLGFALYSSEEACQTFFKRLSDNISIHSFRGFHIFLMTSLLITRFPNSVQYILPIITSSFELFKKVFNMLYLFTKVCNHNLYQYQKELAFKSLDFLFSETFDQPIDPYINILIQFVIIHIQLEKPDLTELTFKTIIEYFTTFQFTSASITYKYDLIIENEQWKDKEFVLKFVSQIYLLKKITNFNFTLLISFLCHPLYGYDKVNSVLDRFVLKIGSDESIWIPTLYQVSKHQKKFVQAKKFMNKFSKLTSKPNLDLFKRLTEYGDEKLQELMPRLKLSHDIFFISRMDYEYETEDISKQMLNQWIEYNKEQQHQFGEHWNQLDIQLSYELSPFFKEELNKNYYKRRNYYDYKLRPSVFLRGKPDSHQLKSEEDTRNENNLDKFVGEIYYYSCKAIMSKIKSNTSGKFYFTYSNFIFISNSFKITRIELSKISHFFWADSPIDLDNSDHHSFQIFLNNRHCYLFTFPEDTIPTLINNKYIKKDLMPSLRFFQDKESSELIQEKHLIQKWQQIEISNFDYLMLLNFLNGRSYLNKNAYPIFPRVFVPNDKNHTIVDFTNYKTVQMTAEMSQKMISEYLSSYDPFKGIEMEKTFSAVSDDVPPDFYITEKFFNSDSSENNSEKLYEMRNALESSEIKLQLHIWINKTFPKLFNQENPPFKSLEQKLNPGIAFSEKVVAGLQNLNVFDLILDPKSSIFYVIDYDRSIYKAKTVARSALELLGKVYFLSRYLSLTSRYLFFAYGIHIGFVDLESEKLKKFVYNIPVISEVTCITSLDDMCAIGSSDGSIVLWRLNRFPFRIQNIPRDMPSIPPQLAQSVMNAPPIPNLSSKLRTSSAATFSNIPSSRSKPRSSSVHGLEPIRPDTKQGIHQSSSRNSLLIQSQLPSDSNDINQRLSTDENSDYISSNLPLLTSDKSFLFVHKNEIQSIQLSRHFNLCISLDVKGLIAISLLPSLELITTIQLDQSITPQKLIFVEGFGTIVVLGEKVLPNTSKVSCLTSFTANGTLLSQLVLDENVKIVDICPIISTNSKLDYVAAAYNNDVIAAHNAYTLKQEHTIYHYDYRIKTIKYSQAFYLFIVCFRSPQDSSSSPKPPQIFPYYLD